MSLQLLSRRNESQHVTVDPQDSSRTAIVGATSTVRDQSRFGDGLLATTKDPRLADLVVGAMNHLDPEMLKRGRRGFGWW
jgi:hypothetical protein